MASPPEILDVAIRRASADLDRPLIDNPAIVSNVEYVCRNIQNRAGARLLLACLLAKVHKPETDIRKPYTEIGEEDVYSGRTYDETYITTFVTEHDLPCNPTTAFLTPALRNRNAMLTPDVDLVGRPPRLYQTVLQLFDDVQANHISAEILLAEALRWLLIVRDERRHRTETLLAALKSSRGDAPLSAEAIVRLIEQHIHQPRASRLPVLVVAAAYRAASQHLGERVLPLASHTAADRQTKASGDLEITLLDDHNVVTGYEMKTRRVTRDDIDRALQKIDERRQPIQNYIFITTDTIDNDVSADAASVYEKTGIEMVILDCVSFLRHFLHLFHRLRMDFLEEYQRLVLIEPESAVHQPLKEVFLTLRQAAESGE